MRLRLAILLALLATAATAEAQIVSGTLLETQTRSPLSGGVVTLLDQDSAAVARLQTDSLGAFHFTVPRRGTYRLRAESPGYRAATSPALSIGALDTLDVEFSLAHDAVVLEPLVVKARNRRLTPMARRFYDRAKISAFGNFLTREDIEKFHPVRTTELLRRIPGVQTSPVMGGNVVTIRGGCRPTLYVDGSRIWSYRTVDDLVQPLEVEGVEVYRSADQAPAEYTGMHAGCAVILIWTRIE
ncbi:MAG: carboxypeptidase regulatory-like domain-containing protein [Gemmatimonadetes bacterium]|nr:carboxypeptidase regulatory-like domain-containing protein [Gemmatimonadota bacterium]